VRGKVGIHLVKSVARRRKGKTYMSWRALSSSGGSQQGGGGAQRVMENMIFIMIKEVRKKM